MFAFILHTSTTFNMSYFTVDSESTMANDGPPVPRVGFFRRLLSKYLPSDRFTATSTITPCPLIPDCLTSDTLPWFPVDDTSITESLRYESDHHPYSHAHSMGSSSLLRLDGSDPPTVPFIDESTRYESDPIPYSRSHLMGISPVFSSPPIVVTASLQKNDDVCFDNIDDDDSGDDDT